MESATRIFEALSGRFRWTLMTNRDTPRTARWRALGARVVVQPLSDNAPRALRGLQLGLWALRLRGLSRDGATHVLHSNDIRAAQALMPAARRTGKPLLHTVRDTKPPGEGYGAHWHRMARQATRVITLSDEMAEMVSGALALPEDRRETIHSIVDLARFAPAADRAALRRDLGLAPDRCHVGIVAGVFAKKGQLEFLRDVAPGLCAARPDLCLHLIGDHDPARETYARDCAAAAAAPDLAGRVVFHGFTDRVADWLAALDVVVVASVREGLARCMIEAMAAGVPVVSTRVCSAGEMLERTGAGRVVARGDAAAMTAAILELARDGALRARMGAAGRETALRLFDIETLAARWDRLYRATAQQT